MSFALCSDIKVGTPNSASDLLIFKIPWDQKLVDCSLDSLYEEKYLIFKFFLDKRTTYLQALQEHQTYQIPTLYEPVVKFCSKWVLFSKELLHAATWLKLPKDWRVGC
jgi:hypothetical protein